jgi:hypothetical protein
MRPCAAAQVLEEPVEIRPDCVRRELQLRTDLLVRKTESDQPDDLSLPG